MTNADQHREEHGIGQWRTSSILRRCSRYFGTYGNCKLAITKGEEFFDTQEQTADERPGSHYAVCSRCANNLPIPRAMRRQA